MTININQLVAELEQRRFFGTVSFQFRDGQLVLIKREETLLPSNAERLRDPANYGRPGQHGTTSR